MSETVTETFDLLDAIQGVSYPESVVTIYLNPAAIKEIESFDSQLENVDPETEVDEENALFEKRAELIEAARKSAIHIGLKGIPRAIVNALTKHVIATVKDKNEQANEVNRQFVIRSIVGITDSEGRKANFDEDNLNQFLQALREPDWERVLGSANELSFRTLKYEQKVTDPNFS